MRKSLLVVALAGALAAGYFGGTVQSGSAQEGPPTRIPGCAHCAENATEHADECWSIYEGELAWTLEGRSEPVRVKAGEWIFAPANTFHLIEVLGERPAIRIAITPAGEYHRHDRADTPPAPPGARQ